MWLYLRSVVWVPLNVLLHALTYTAFLALFLFLRSLALTSRALIEHAVKPRVYQCCRVAKVHAEITLATRLLHRLLRFSEQG